MLKNGFSKIIPAGYAFIAVMKNTTYF